MGADSFGAALLQLTHFPPSSPLSFLTLLSSVANCNINSSPAAINQGRKYPVKLFPPPTSLLPCTRSPGNEGLQAHGSFSGE